VVVAGKARPAIARLVQPVRLDHRAHRAVHDEDAPVEGGDELVQATDSFLLKAISTPEGIRFYRAIVSAKP